MSRSISISYRDETSGQDIPIEVRSPYDLLGTQGSSKHFWSIPRIKQIGIQRLAELGVTDPVYFFGWGEMKLLDHEIKLLAEHLGSIEFHSETKATWLSNLTYCYHVLIESAPKKSIPIFGIG